jgi:hypothetical protein
LENQFGAWPGTITAGCPEKRNPEVTMIGRGSKIEMSLLKHPSVKCPNIK